MSHRVATSIRIGGPIHRRLAVPLAEAITDEALSLDWGRPHFSPTNESDLLTAADRSSLFLCDDQHFYNAFNDLEAFLRSHHIAFDRHSSAHDQFNGELVRYRPGMRKPFTWHATQKGQALISRKPLARAIKVLNRPKILQGPNILGKAIGPAIAPLKPLSFTGRGRSSPATLETSVLETLGL